jgi:glucosyl-dolichyl phosphate glucuronosyltransferase
MPDSIIPEFNECKARYTVFICTRNRADIIEDCLKSLVSLTSDGYPKICVIDNGSTDHTFDTCKKYFDHLSYHELHTVGLSKAKNKAIEICDTEYAIFLDDDGIPEPTWLDGIEEAISQNADVFGGPYIPYYRCPKPKWFLDHFGSAHLELKDGLQSEPVFFSGGNMGIRKSLAKRMNGFDQDLGMSGNNFGLGEETKLQMNIHEIAPESRFVYSSNMIMRHLVSKEKMSIRYIAKRNFHYGKIINSVDINNRLVRMSIIDLLKLMRFGTPIFYSIIARDRNRYVYWLSYVASYLNLHAMTAGVIVQKLSTMLSNSDADRAVQR